MFCVEPIVGTDPCLGHASCGAGVAPSLGRFTSTLAMKNPPPAPPGWNLTISDLSNEVKAGKRNFIGQPEIEWARNYERGLIPIGTRYPRKGDVYEALSDMNVHYMTAWAAPFTGGGEGSLKMGEQVFLDHEPLESNPIGFYAVAVDYDAIERRMVPSIERSNEKYGGFYFAFKTVDIGSKLRLVKTGYEKNG